MKLKRKYVPAEMMALNMAGEDEYAVIIRVMSKQDMTLDDAAIFVGRDAWPDYEKAEEEADAVISEIESAMNSGDKALAIGNSLYAMDDISIVSTNVVSGSEIAAIDDDGDVNFD